MLLKDEMECRPLDVWAREAVEDPATSWHSLMLRHTMFNTPARLSGDVRRSRKKRYVMLPRASGFPLCAGVVLVLMALEGLGENMTLSHDEDHGTVTLSKGDQTVWLYTYGDVTFKPYVKELRTPKGRNVLLDSPPDHIHHHGLMLALGVDKVDFWGEHDPAAVGTQSTGAVKMNQEKLGFASEIHWNGPDGARLLEEERTLLWHEDENASPTLLTWSSCLAAPEGAEKALLWGRHYFGLGMRFPGGMTGGTFLFADEGESTPVRGTEHLTCGRWCAIQGKVGGEPVTVAQFDHPRNPRHPARWFTMNAPFAYLSATLNLKEKPLAIAKGEPVSLLYGVAVWDGHTAREQIEAQYRAWLRIAASLPRTNKGGNP